MAVEDSPQPRHSSHLQRMCVPEPSLRELVGIVAALMSVNALAIDTMLGALPAMGVALGVHPATRLTWVVGGYVLGYGVALPFFGMVSDHVGRRRLILGGLAVYVVGSALIAMTSSWPLLVLLRLMQGAGGACSVLALAVARDRYSGPILSRILSLAFAAFVAVPVLAPAVGQGLLAMVSWRGVFGFIAGCGAVVWVWVACRLPESLPAERRQRVQAAAVRRHLAAIAADRPFVVHTAAMTALLGGLYGLINCCQPLIAHGFGVPSLFPLVFGGVAVSVAIAAVVNQRLVTRWGASVTAGHAVNAYLMLALGHAAMAWWGRETLGVFLVFQVPMMFCFGLALSNLGAVAMAGMGERAGTAAAVQGALTSIGGGLVGLVIGQHADGTALGLTLGSLLCALVARLLLGIPPRHLAGVKTEARSIAPR
ncbi:MFS transporter [Roseateles sp. SL47]|uniref:MFS transporter n=1 Tax=Roseateles sp. SL47 TaxID=2995138 RepID=UPI00226DB4A5|nr:MFS transporter [Roseateles sp. SL47]WAC71663.1 MFS transporter [Roseateles sp. SL47]